jgi:hypothetical protein
MAMQQSNAVPVGVQPTTPDTNLTDRQLEANLNSELDMIEHDPSAGSEWATAFGSTTSGLNLGGGAGGYRFSSQELGAVIDQWHTVLQRAQTYDWRIHLITAMTSAAEDEASTAFTGQAQGLGRNVEASHQTLKAYAAAYVAKLEAARDNYTSTERAITTSLQGGNPHP